MEQFDQCLQYFPFFQHNLDTSQVKNIFLLKLEDKYGKQLRCQNNQGPAR